MIKLSSVTKQYEDGFTAVDNLSFAVKEGEAFGLIGTSGCGKTTTLKMINRLIEPTSGSIFINGQPVDSQAPEQLRRRIGYVIQEVGLFPHYTVEENISVTPKLLGWESSRIEQRSGELLDLVGLTSSQIAGRKPNALSGGQQQRVGLARALAADPPIILMDEPFGGVDPITKEHIQKAFKKLLQKIKKTIVLVTHDVFEAFDFCNRICLMNRGQAQQIGPLKELLFHPANDFVRSFFDEHRLQLEMMCVTIEDILAVMKPGFDDDVSSKNLVRGDDKTIHLNDSFFSVFENMHTRQGNYRILNAADELIGSINADELLKGFQTVRRNL